MTKIIYFYGKINLEWNILSANNKKKNTYFSIFFHFTFRGPTQKMIDKHFKYVNSALLYMLRNSRDFPNLK